MSLVIVSVAPLCPFCRTQAMRIFRRPLYTLADCRRGVLASSFRATLQPAGMYRPLSLLRRVRVPRSAYSSLHSFAALCILTLQIS